jgi:enterobacterial common antigen flippase
MAAKDTYGQILRSSALVGASSALEICLRIVRSKVMAILLGPTGVGLFGLYTSIVDLAQTFAGLGVNRSGVREIAQIITAGESDRIARIVSVIRSTTIGLGIVGAGIVAMFAREISEVTFGTGNQATWVSLLSIAVLFQLVASGEQAVIQGARRIADLARIAAWCALLGTCFTIPVVYFLGERGLVPSIVAAGALNLAVSRWYGRRVTPATVRITASQLGRDLSPLLKLGIAFMLSGLMTMGSGYWIRVIVLRETGLEAAGLYQAAWTIGGIYVGFILQAMGTDFFPRLAAVAHDDAECNRLVNEQTRVSLLLGGPGVLTMLALAPIGISILYTTQFQGAVEPLRWICLGMMLRVITWPIGFIFVAKGKQNLFLAIDLAYSLVHVGLAWILVKAFGVTGAGLAFFGSYAFHLLLVYPIARHVSGFRYARENRNLGLVFLPLIAVVFEGFRELPSPWATCLGLLAALASGVLSLRTLAGLVGSEQSHPVLRRLLRILRVS